MKTGSKQKPNGCRQTKKNGKLQAKRKKLHLMHTESGEGQGFSGNSNIGVGIGSTSIK